LYAIPVLTKTDPTRIVFSILVQVREVFGTIVRRDINVAAIIEQAGMRRTEKHSIGVDVRHHLPLLDAGQHF
jgi:hypothetical protein